MGCNTIDMDTHTHTSKVAIGIRNGMYCKITRHHTHTHTHTNPYSHIHDNGFYLGGVLHNLYTQKDSHVTITIGFIVNRHCRH